jgi:hypothetical protein
MRRIIVGIAALLVAACGQRGPAAPSEFSGPRLDAAGPPITTGSWYRPALDVTWQWQLTGSLETGYQAEIYDVDLFETSAAALAALRSHGRRILCYFSAGSVEDGRPDAGRFPAEGVGHRLDGYPGERWLDIRRRDVLDVMVARLDLAVAKGCDGVEPDNVTAYQNDSGFPLTAADQLTFNRHLANEAHRRNLAIALKNAGDQVPDLVAYFDLELNEECHQYDECQQLDAFIAGGKPVLNAEYASSLADAERLSARVCPQAAARRLRTLILPKDLDASFRVSCF